MNEIKNNLSIPADLTITSLLAAINLMRKFSIKPEYLILKFSIEQIMNIFYIEKYIKSNLCYLGFYRMLLFNFYAFKVLYGIRYINFICDRNMPYNSWEIFTNKKDTIYKIFSEGA